MSRFVLFILPSISLTACVRTPGQCSKKKQRHNFPPPTPTKTTARFDDSKAGSTTVKRVQCHPSGFQDDEAHSTTPKHIRQRFEVDSTATKRIQRQQSRFNDGETDSMTSKRIPRRRSGFHDNQGDSTMTKKIRRRIRSGFHDDEEDSTNLKRISPRRRRFHNNDMNSTTTTPMVIYEINMVGDRCYSSDL